MAGYSRRPEWLRLKPLKAPVLAEISKLTSRFGLHTVCESACCPNRPQCFANKTVTFMILGNTCTRNCAFCAVNHGRPDEVNPEEPTSIAAAVKELGLKYAVITSVTRDDLADGGSAHFARTVRAIHQADPDIPVEVLIPDFQGSKEALAKVVDAKPAVINHNIETVSRLYPEVRPQANYHQSLELLKRVKTLDNQIITKSGLMLGLGESQEEVMATMTKLRQAGCDMLTIGQYLPPSLKHHRLIRYVTPAEFAMYQKIGREKGFSSVFSGPLVRSSFHAAEEFQAVTKGITNPFVPD